MTGEVAPTIINAPLSDLQVSIGKRMPGQVRSLVDNKLLNTDDFVHTVRTKVERVLSLHPQPSPLGPELGYASKDTVEELSKESDRATTASPYKFFPTKTGNKPCRGGDRREREDNISSHKTRSWSGSQLSSQREIRY